MADKKDLVITRVFNVPREKVWQAWTEPEQFMKWWGPKDFTAPVAELDVRVGGKYLAAMQAADGKKYLSTGIYKEVVPMEKLVWTDSFADEKGNVVPASYYGMGEDFPMEMTVTITFEDQGDKTKLTLRHEGMPAGEDGEMASAGWNESLDKLATAVEN